MSAGSSRRQPSRQDSGIRFLDGEDLKQVNPSSVVAPIEEVEASGDRLDDSLPALELPGHGERYDDCGDDIPRFCAGCGSTSSCGRTCYRSACPRCWRGWDRRRATTITSKLEALRKYRESARAGWDGWKFHHLAISPPDDFALDSEEPLQRTFDLLKELLDELGAETGYLLYHPYRGEDGSDMGFWKNVLPDVDETDWQDTEDQLAHEPHFHAVVLSKHIPTEHVTPVLEERTGWTLKRITKGGDDSESDVSIYGKYDLARVVTYTLSHCGIGENRAAYRAFGEVANFSATEAIRAEMDAAVRSVAPRTLGLEFDDLTCLEEGVDDDRDDSHDHSTTYQVNTGAAEASASHTGTNSLEFDDFTGPSGDESSAESFQEDRDDRCRGRLLSIRSAPAFLDDEDWCERAPHVDQLVEAWETWRERIDGDPNWSPVDEGATVDEPPD